MDREMGFLDGGEAFLFVQHVHTLAGVSPKRALIAGSVQPRTRVSIVRWNLKEVFGKYLV